MKEDLYDDLFDEKEEKTDFQALFFKYVIHWPWFIAAIPEHCIQRWNLVQLPCSDNQSLYLNALVYHKQYAMSEIEAGFVQFVREHKAFV